jgi:hypothetical protein
MAWYSVKAQGQFFTFNLYLLHQGFLSGLFPSGFQIVFIEPSHLIEIAGGSRVAATSMTLCPVLVVIY